MKTGTQYGSQQAQGSISGDRRVAANRTPVLRSVKDMSVFKGSSTKEGHPPITTMALLQRVTGMVLLKG